MENQWRQVVRAFQQTKRQVKQQRQGFNENRSGLDTTELRLANLRVKTGLHLPKPIQNKQEMVTRVRQNSLLPPLKNASLPSYNKNN